MSVTTQKTFHEEFDILSKHFSRGHWVPGLQRKPCVSVRFKNTPGFSHSASGLEERLAQLKYVKCALSQGEQHKWVRFLCETELSCSEGARSSEWLELYVLSLNRPKTLVAALELLFSKWSILGKIVHYIDHLQGQGTVCYRSRESRLDLAAYSFFLPSESRPIFKQDQGSFRNMVWGGI